MQNYENIRNCQIFFISIWIDGKGGIPLICYAENIYLEIGYR